MNTNEKIERESLVEDIRSVKEQLAKTPTKREYNTYGDYSATTVADRFGSWADGVRQAGLEPNAQRHKPQISDEEIIEDIKKVADDLGKTPEQLEYNEHGEYSVSTAQDRFGTWNKAVSKAGLKPNRRGGNEKIPKEELLSDVEKVAEELNRTPRKVDYDRLGEYHPDTLEKRFGSWNNAVEAAGLEPNNKFDPYTREQAIEDIKRVAGELGGAPTWDEYQNQGKWSPYTMKRKFGSWPDAVKAAGLEPRGRGVGGGYFGEGWQNDPIPESDLLDDLEDVVKKLGHPPTKKEYTKHGEYSGRTLTRRFGGWEKAMAEIGIDYTVGKIPAGKIIADIRSVADDLGRAPTKEEYDEHGNHSSQTASNRFGGWSDAVKEAGLKPLKSADDEIILLDLVEVAERLGNAPTTDEYDRYGYYTSNIIKDRFPGKWQVLATEAYQMAKEMDGG